MKSQRIYQMIAPVLFVVAGAFAFPAAAQEAGATSETGSGYAPVVAYPSSDFNWLRHSSTAAEGRLRGAASFVESAGKGNYYHSLAALNYQEAYRRALDNAVHRADAYYARQDLWYDHQEKYRRKPLDMEGYQKLAASRAPDRLSAEQYDADSGAVRWPFPLDSEVFRSARQAVEKHLSDRSIENAGWGSRNYAQLRAHVESMRSLLDAARESLPPDQFVLADSFLDSVLWEGRFVPDAAAANEEL